MKYNINHLPILTSSRIIRQSEAVLDKMQSQQGITVESGADKVRALGNSWKDAQSFLRILRTSGRWLLFGDIMALLISCILGQLVSGGRFWFPELGAVHALKASSAFIALGITSVLWLDAKGHYRCRLPFWETVLHVMALTVAGCVTYMAGRMLDGMAFNATGFLLNWIIFIVLLVSMRSIVRSLLDACGKWKIPAMLISSCLSTETAMRVLEREPGMGFRVIEQVAPEMLGTFKGPNAWKYFLTLHNVSHVFLSFEPTEFHIYDPIIRAMVRERVPFSIVLPLIGLPAGVLSYHYFLMQDVLLVHVTDRRHLLVSSLLKRGFDIIVSGLVLLLTSPVFAVVALKVRKDGGPAFFSQPRIGRGGEVFQCYKFRSMRVDAEEFLEGYLAENPGARKEWEKFQKLKDDIRISKIGHFIRKTSIDELPQLFNVLKGDMSIVGPRPIISSQQEFYGDDFVYYERVRPGITGPWQVSGRNRLTFSERIQLECSYVRNWSLWMDIVILLKTIPAVLEKDSVF